MKHLLGMAVLLFLSQAQAVSVQQDQCSFIRDAIDKLPHIIGGTVKIPAGTFVCESPIIINKDNIKLKGAGESQTLLKVAPNRYMPLLVIGHPETVNVRLRKFDAFGVSYESWEPLPVAKFKMNLLVRSAALPMDKLIDERQFREGKASVILGDPNANTGYVVRPVYNVEVSDFTLDGGVDIDAIKDQPHLEQLIRDNECYHASTNSSGNCDNDPSSIRNNGITIRGGNHVVVRNVTAQRMASGGLVTEKQCDNLKVINFTSRKNYFDGMAGYQTSNSLFKDLHLNENRGAGISLDINFDKNVLENVEITNTGDVGIFMRHASRNFFRDLKITYDATTNAKGEASAQFGGGSFGVFLAAARPDARMTCTYGNVFERPVIKRARGVAFIMNDECIHTQTIAERMTLNESMFYGNTNETVKNKLIDYQVEGTIEHPVERSTPICVREAKAGTLEIVGETICK